MRVHFFDFAVSRMARRKGLVVFSTLIGGQLLLVLFFVNFEAYFKTWKLELQKLGKDNGKNNFNISRKVILKDLQNLISLQDLKNRNFIPVKKWTMTRESMLSEGQNASMSKARLDFLLLVRKLVLFSIREVNRQIKEEDCVHWWVNPLSVEQLEARNISSGIIEYKLMFEAQPGRIPFETTVIEVTKSQKNQKRHFYELFFVSGTRRDELNMTCGTVNHNLRNVCICPEEKRKAEEMTAKVRSQWNVSDPELFSWPPNVPMFVSDYISFDDENLYIKSPSIQIEFCNPGIIKMIFFISSKPSHTIQRTTIRSTFGNYQFLNQMGIRLLFLFGKIEDLKLQKEIDEEFHKHEDIVQVNYADSYHNLSLSHLSMYNWVIKRCSQGIMPRWLFKADDDFFLNPKVALLVAAENPHVQFLGAQFCGTKAIRNVGYMKKYYVPRYMYAPDWYAGYLSGVAYLVRTDALQEILDASLTTPLIHMDDAYVMGLLTREVGIRPRGSTLFSYGRTTPHDCQSKRLLSSYVFNSSDMVLQWNNFRKEVRNRDKCTLEANLLKAITLNPSVNHDCFYE